jgi:hypothetical protein
MTEQKDFKARFTFHVIYHNGRTAQELTNLNFFTPLKEFGNEDLAVENSTQIVECFGKITDIFQDYMRRITEDMLYKHSDEPIPKQDPNSRYIFKLVDHEAAVRENGTISQNKEVRVLYEHEIYANDFFAVQNLSIIPIWKDNEINAGIRTTLKETLSMNKYYNRFKKRFQPVNTFSVNSKELYR